MLDIADNSGVKRAQCIRVLGKGSSKKGKYHAFNRHNRRYCMRGDKKIIAELPA